MELAADHHHPTHQVRAAERDVHRRRGPVAEADEVGGPADDLLQERDRVGGDHLEVEGALDVRGATVRTAIRRVQPETGRVLRAHRIELIGVAEAAVQVDQRLTGPVDRVPGAHPAEVDHRFHGRGP